MKMSFVTLNYSVCVFSVSLVSAYASENINHHMILDTLLPWLQQVGFPDKVSFKRLNLIGSKSKQA